MRKLIIASLFLASSFAIAQTSRRSVIDYDVRAFGRGALRQSARLLTPKPNQTRSAAASTNPQSAAVEFLRQAGLSSLRLSRVASLGSGTIVEFDKTVGATPVFEGRAKVAIDGNGEVIAAVLPAAVPEHYEPEQPERSVEEAIRLVLRAAGYRLATGLTRTASIGGMEAFENPIGVSRRPILASLVVFPVDDQTARLAWRVLADVDDSRWYEVVVDAGSGRTLFVQNLYRRAGVARVWKVGPHRGDREVVSIPDAWLPPSAQVTTGNAADVYLDTDGDNRPDTLPDSGIRNGRAFSQSLSFDFPAPSAGGGDPRTFRAAAVTNAFYFVNLAHDYFQGLGFDETSGNFQTDNGNRGGLGGDPVLVEVQDRFEIDNASISLTPEGMSPRMELGIVSLGTPGRTDDRDFAYDGQTVIHEYSHGVANRLVGGGTSTSCLTGTQSRALDEGWADYFSSSYFNDPVQSAYVATNPARGIRRQSYEGYTFTYEDLGNEGFVAHGDGEIWAATLWDIRKTLTATVADRLVVHGMRLTPCRPTFTDARDAILAADRALNNGANRAALYTVFARHGLGASAGGFDGNRDTFTVFNAAFDLPPDLRPGNQGPVVTSRPMGFAVSGEVFSYQIQATDPDGGRLLYELSQGPTGMTVDSATGLVRWTASFASRRAKIAITDGQGGRVIHGIQVTVVTPLRPGVPTTISENSGGGIATIQVPSGTPVLQVTLREGRGDADIGLLDPEGFVDFGSPRNGQFETLSVGSPTPGQWFVVVAAVTPFENVQLTASLPQPRVLTGNETLTGLTNVRSSETFYRLTVPPGATAFSVEVTGGSGDVDVTVARQIPPVCQVFEEFISFRCFFDNNYASFFFGNNEEVSVSSPQPGDWYINLTSASGYNGATMTTRMTVRPTLVVSANTVTFESIVGSAAPAAQTIRITDPSRSQFAWTATQSANSAWLKLDKTSGTGDSSLAVSVDPAGLAAGTYNATIVINGAGLGSSPQNIAVRLQVVTPPGIAVNPVSLTFQGAPGVNPPVQRLAVSNTGSGTLAWTATVTTTSGGDWLSIDQPRGTGNVNLQVIVTARNLAPGVYQGSIAIGATGAATVNVPVRYTVAVPFVVTEQSLRSVASMRLGYPVSPGEMMLLEGSNFVDACSLDPAAEVRCPQAAEYALPKLLGGIRVTVNDIDSPMLLALPNQIRFLVPFEVQGSEARIVVYRQGVASAPILREIQTQTLGIFSLSGDGTGPGHIYHADGRLVTAEAPLGSDETFLVLTGGLGAVDPPVTSGAAGPADPLAKVTTTVRAFLDGVECTVVSAHLAPGLAGFYHVQITAPSSFITANPVLLLQSAVSSSNEVTAAAVPTP
jgi:uncharacterized protein (TIGR03437 family)